MSQFETYFIIGAIIAIAFVLLVILLIWCIISSAVANGVEIGIERILRKYTDLTDYMKEPLHPESPKQREDKTQ